MIVIAEEPSRILSKKSEIKFPVPVTCITCPKANDVTINNNKLLSILLITCLIFKIPFAQKGLKEDLREIKNDKEFVGKREEILSMIYLLSLYSVFQTLPTPSAVNHFAFLNF